MDLNKLKNYKKLALNLCAYRQRDKVIEEIDEFIEAGNREEKIHEGLDVITAMLNYLFKLGITEEEFEEHIKKLDRYEVEKY